ncbi:MAG: hypothetical protein QX189_09295 [Methylococcales bacterium]
MRATAPVKVAPVSLSSLSTKWRISTIIKRKTPPLYVSIYATDIHNHTRRVLPSNCVFDPFGQPTCIIDHEIVTLFSGIPEKKTGVLLSSN